MAEEIASLAIKVDALQAKVAALELDKLEKSGKNAAAGITSLEKASAGVSSALNALGISVGALGLVALGRDILNTNREFEALRAQLKSVTGSAEGAAAAFGNISRFAKNTPFEVADITKSYITLQNFGIKPTSQVLEALTNQASKSGASAETLAGITLALGQAYAKGKLQAEEMNQLIERGVPIYQLLSEVTGKNSAALQEMAKDGEITRDVIDQLIGKMGEMASGSNAAAMDTLNGKISNLSDSWHAFSDELLNGRAEEGIKNFVDLAIGLLDSLTGNLKATHTELINLYNFEKIAQQGLQSVQPKQIPAEGFINNLSVDSSGAGSQIDPIIQKTEKLAIATGGASKAHKAHASAMSDAQRAAQQLASDYKSLIAELEKEKAVSEFSNKERERASFTYDLLYGKFKNLTDAQKEYAASLAAQADKNKEIVESSESHKTELDGLIDAYNKLTLSARDYYSLTLTTKGIAPDQQGDLLAQFDKNAGAEAQKKSIDDATAAVKNYNTEIDNASSSMTSLSDVMSSVFDGALGGVNLLTGAISKMSKALADNSGKLKDNKQNQGYANLIKDTESLAKFKKEEIKLNDERFSEELKGLSQISGATSELFGKKTTEAKAFHTLEIALSIASMAQKAREIASTLAQTAVDVAGGAAKFFSQSGWFGFAGVAAMAAVMAGLGFMTNAGGGSSSLPPTNKGTGSVLGDSTAESESIKNSIDILKSNSSLMLPLTEGMLRALKNIETSIAGVGALFAQSSFFQAGGDTGGLGLGSQKNFGGIQGILAKGNFGDFLGIGNKIVSMIFGSTKRSIEDFGIKGFSQKIQDILQRGFDAVQYTDIKIKKSSFFGLFSSTKFEENTSPLDKELKQQFGLIFKNFASAINLAGNALGVSSSEFTKRLNSFVVDIGKVSFKGLKGDEIQKKLEAVFGKVGDDLARFVYDGLTDFQKVGEGYLQTLVRVATGVEKARVALDQLGVRAIHFTSIINKQSDVEEEIVRQSLLNVKGLGKGIYDIIKLFDGAGSDLIELYQDLIEVKRLLENARLGGNVSSDIITGAGGLDKLSSSLKNYMDKFYSEGERASMAMRNLTTDFRKLGLQAPETEAAFRAMVEAAARDTTAAGRKYLGKLLAMVDTVSNALEIRKAAQQTAINNAMSGLQRALDAQARAQREAQQAHQALRDAQIKATNELISNLNKIKTALTSALTATKVSTPATNLAERKAAQTLINNASSAEGSVANIQGLENALQVISKPSENLYASFQDYARSQAQANTAINKLKVKADTELSVAQETLDAIQSASDQANDNAQSMMDYYQQQIDALNGIDSSVKTVPEAIAALESAIGAAQITKIKGDLQSAQAPIRQQIATFNKYISDLKAKLAAAQKARKASQIIEYQKKIEGYTKAIAIQNAKIKALQTEANSKIAQQQAALKANAPAAQQVANTTPGQAAANPAPAGNKPATPAAAATAQQATVNAVASTTKAVNATTAAVNAHNTAGKKNTDALIAEVKALRSDISTVNSRLSRIASATEGTDQTLDRLSAGGGVMQVNVKNTTAMPVRIAVGGVAQIVTVNNSTSNPVRTRPYNA